MKILTFLKEINRKGQIKSKSEKISIPHLMETPDKSMALLKTGRQQFKRLMELGLNIPVRLA